MKILLFGGSFNPPHNGHISLLENAVKKIMPELVIVIPAGIPPHKVPSEVDSVHRIAMCKAFLPCFQHIVIDAREIYRSGKSYTIDTVQELKQEYPNAQFFLCVGSDMIKSFQTWHRYKDLLKEVTLVAQLRDKQEEVLLHKQKQQLEEEGGTVLLLQGPIEELSSSEIRARVTQGEDVSSLVPPIVNQYIQEHHLYSEGERYRSDFRKRK